MLKGKNRPAMERIYAYWPKMSGPAMRAKSTLFKKLKHNKMHFSAISNTLFFIPEEVDMAAHGVKSKTRYYNA